MLKNHIQPQHLDSVADLHQQFAGAEGFPHIAIENFLDPEFLGAALDVFPSPENMMYHYDSVFEKDKYTSDLANMVAEGEVPDAVMRVMQFMSSPPALGFFEAMSGIEGLIPDPYFHGAGMHQTMPGGYLDVHIDFNRASRLKLYRRLNVIIYLSRDWEEEWGGHLELWTGHERGDGLHELDDQVARIAPVFNTIGVFATSERSYHGQPHPLTCPPGQTRKSLALYYYTVDRNDDCAGTPLHRTTYVSLPGAAPDPGLDKLRHARNKMFYRDFVKYEADFRAGKAD